MMFMFGYEIRICVIRSRNEIILSVKSTVMLKGFITIKFFILLLRR